MSNDRRIDYIEFPTQDAAKSKEFSLPLSVEV